MIDRKEDTITELAARERRWSISVLELLRITYEMGVIPIVVDPCPGWEIIDTKIVQTNTGIEVVVIEIKERSVHGFLRMERTDPQMRAGSNF